MKEILITSSVLILVLMLLRLAFSQKVSRKLIYGAWVLVALRLLIPVQIGQLNFSVLTAAQPLTETVEAVSELRVIGQNEREADIQVTKEYIEQDRTVFVPEVQEYIQKLQEAGESAEEIATTIVKTQGSQLYVPEVQEQVAQQVEAQTDYVSLGQVAKLAWLCGVGGMALWFAFVNLRHSRSLRKNREKLDIQSPIPVYVSDAASSPCLVGLLRPAVYLTPASAAHPQMLEHVVKHELTHYRHGDHIWSLVRCLCLCLYWFDPLVWIAAYLSRRDCELACDEGAMRGMDAAERVSYGKTLLEVVSHAARHANLLQTATAMNETKKQLKERVCFIVKKPKISITAAICMVLVCAIVAGCAAAGPNVPDPGTQPSQNVPTTTQPTTAPQEPTIWLTREMKLTYWGEHKLYCSYTVNRDTCYPNDWVSVEVEVINLGEPIDFEGPLEEQLSTKAWLSADHGDYSIESYGLTVSRDYADNVFKTGTMLRMEYHFQIPEDIVAGSYSLVISVFDVQVRFDEETVVEGLENQANGDLAELMQQMVVNEELAAITSLFGQRSSWYNCALTCQYATPEQINLYDFFLDGFPGEFTDEERAELDEHIAELEERFGGELPTYCTKRLPVDQMNQVLTDLFGITLEDVEPEGTRALSYLEKTNCYYIIGGGAAVVQDFNALGLRYMEDGSICVVYTAGWEDTLYMLTLMPSGDSYKILSNVRVDT